MTHESFTFFAPVTSFNFAIHAVPQLGCPMTRLNFRYYRHLIRTVVVSRESRVSTPLRAR